MSVQTEISGKCFLSEPRAEKDFNTGTVLDRPFARSPH